MRPNQDKRVYPWKFAKTLRRQDGQMWRRAIRESELTDDILYEVILVFGTCKHKGMNYWYEVWEYLTERYPMLFQGGEFPDQRTMDAAHEHDMHVLSAIHTWQRTVLSHGESGSA